MNKQKLIKELEDRGASKSGNMNDLVQRLLYLRELEVEKNLTNGDMDEIGGQKCLTMLYDNATPHTATKNLNQLREIGKTFSQPFTIQFILQPARSPDLNKNDMFFFSSLASRTSKLENKSSLDRFENIVVNVCQAFDDYPIDSLIHCYAETFEVYKMILRSYGGNDFKMPHGKIIQNELRGTTNPNYFVDVDVVENAKRWLNDNPLVNPDIKV